MKIAAPTKFGAEPKRLAILGGLLVVLVVVYFMNRTPAAQPQAATPTESRPVPVRAGTPASGSAALMPPPRNASARGGDPTIQDFKPSLKLPEGTDVSRIDPTLKLDLLAKVQNSPMEGGERSLFDFGAPPRPKTSPPAVQPIKPVTPPVAIQPVPPVAPPNPGPPPIPLKFYGYVNGSRGASRQAFFLDGEDIFVAGENDMIRNRFKVIRIGVNSAVVEDTTTKNQQTLPLVEELPG